MASVIIGICTLCRHNAEEKEFNSWWSAKATLKGDVFNFEEWKKFFRYMWVANFSGRRNNMNKNMG